MVASEDVAAAERLVDFDLGSVDAETTGGVAGVGRVVLAAHGYRVPGARGALALCRRLRRAPRVVFLRAVLALERSTPDEPRTEHSPRHERCHEPEDAHHHTAHCPPQPAPPAAPARAQSRERHRHHAERHFARQRHHCAQNYATVALSLHLCMKHKVWGEAEVVE